MAKLRLSAAARRDLAEIDEYGMVEFGAMVADDYSQGFRETFDLLRHHPRAGAARPELGNGLRSILHGKHRIYYVIHADFVEVRRVFHHSRDVRRANLQ